MKKVNLSNLYESYYPPENTDILWADKDENTGELKAIHKYNKSKGEWEPSMVSVDYLNNDSGEGSNDCFDIYFWFLVGGDDNSKNAAKKWLTENGFDNPDEIVNSPSEVLISANTDIHTTIRLVSSLHESYPTASLVGSNIKIVKSPK